MLNKVDKPDAEPDRALNEVFDLFVTLDADEDQLDFPVLYASGRAGWADAELDGPRKNLDALYQLILDHVPPPAQAARSGEPFAMLATTLAADPFLGRLLTGRIEQGTVRTGQTVHALSRDGREIERFRVSTRARLPRPHPHRRSTAPRPATSSASPAWPRRPSPTPSPTSVVERGAAGAADRPADDQRHLRHQRLARSPAATATRCRAG